MVQLNFASNRLPFSNVLVSNFLVNHIITNFYRLYPNQVGKLKDFARSHQLKEADMFEYLNLFCLDCNDYIISIYHYFVKPTIYKTTFDIHFYCEKRCFNLKQNIISMANTERSSDLIINQAIGRKSIPTEINPRWLSRVKELDKDYCLKDELKKAERICERNTYEDLKLKVCESCGLYFSDITKLFNHLSLNATHHVLSKNIIYLFRLMEEENNSTDILPGSFQFNECVFNDITAQQAFENSEDLI